MANKIIRSEYGTILWERPFGQIRGTFYTAIYKNGFDKDEGLAIQYTTPLYQTPDEIHLSGHYATILFDPHPFPWMCDDVTTGAWCYKLTLQDGTIMGFTSHDQDLIIDGVTYGAATGFSPTAAETSSALNVDNMEVWGSLDSVQIDPDEIAAGRFDYARIKVFIVNWKNLSDPIFIVRNGLVGEIKHGAQNYQTEAVGLTDALQQNGGLIYQKTCPEILGSAKCKINLATYTKTGTVLSAANNILITTLTDTDGYYDYGNLTFTTGDNAPDSMEVKLNIGGKVVLYMDPPYSVQPGDQFTIRAGCDGNFSTCRDRFANVLNFRGHPHVPGNDYATGYAAQGTANTE